MDLLEKLFYLALGATVFFFFIGISHSIYSLIISYLENDKEATIEFKDYAWINFLIMGAGLVAFLVLLVFAFANTFKGPSSPSEVLDKIGATIKTGGSSVKASLGSVFQKDKEKVKDTKSPLVTRDKYNQLMNELMECRQNLGITDFIKS